MCSEGIFTHNLRMQHMQKELQRSLPGRFLLVQLAVVYQRYTLRLTFRQTG